MNFREMRMGVYFLCKDQEVVYVGQSGDVLRRIDEHGDSKDFDSVLLISVPEHLLSEAEQYWIERIKPRLNAAYRTKPKAENELEAQMKNKAITITVPTWLLPEIDRECALQGRSRSNWFMWIFNKDLERLGLTKES
jgi:hypothetical protein